MTGKSTRETTPTEESLSLPINHPQAGYVSPDLSFVDGGELAPGEKEWAEERDAAQKAEAETVAAHEDTVAKAEQEIPDEKSAPKSYSKE